MRTIWVLPALAALLSCGGRLDAGSSDASPEARDDTGDEPRDAGPDVPIPKCTNPCTVSWKNDIWPMMSAPGPWKCGDGRCHGKNANAPYDLSNEDRAYVALVNTKVNGKPYLAPCNTDPDASTILCNLSVLDTCGTRMPYTDNVLQSGPATPAEYAKLATWVACGAPKN